MNKTGRLLFEIFIGLGGVQIIAGVGMIFYVWLTPGADQQLITGGLILVTLGTFFFFLGGTPVFYYSRKKARYRRLLQSGTLVYTTFNRIEMNRAISVNGQSPYIIITHWQDPLNPDKVREFKNLNLWYNPEPYVQEGKEITVFIDPQNEKQYAMDMSHFPEVG